MSSCPCFCNFLFTSLLWSISPISPAPMKRTFFFISSEQFTDTQVRLGPIDLEAKFEPSLLNTAIYLLGLSQQVSTFTINFQVCLFLSCVGSPNNSFLIGSSFPRRNTRKQSFMVWPPWSDCCCIFWCHGFRT